ncbi:MAG: DinB family protein [Dehalococcoidia bacterium]
MSRSAIEQLVFMMNTAFEGDPARPHQSWHAVLVNLSSLQPEDWDWIPPGGRRTVRRLLLELGTSKYVCDSKAFGDGSIDWDTPGSIPSVDIADWDDIVRWLSEAHRRLRDHVAELEDDTQLRHPRPSYWGEEREIRWQVNTMIQHDLYHAGEINHIRALRQEND